MKEKLLKFFPYLKNSLDLTDEEIEIFNNGTNEEKNKIYNRVYQTNITYCNCPDVWKMINERLEIKIIMQNDKDN